MCKFKIGDVVKFKNKEVTVYGTSQQVHPANGKVYPYYKLSDNPQCGAFWVWAPLVDLAEDGEDGGSVPPPTPECPDGSPPPC